MGWRKFSHSNTICCFRSWEERWISTKMYQKEFLSPPPLHLIRLVSQLFESRRDSTMTWTNRTKFRPNFHVIQRHSIYFFSRLEVDWLGTIFQIIVFGRETNHIPKKSGFKKLRGVGLSDHVFHFRLLHSIYASSSDIHRPVKTSQRWGLQFHCETQ